jgi:hypothetical protein
MAWHTTLTAEGGRDDDVDSNIPSILLYLFDSIIYVTLNITPLFVYISFFFVFDEKNHDERCHKPTYHLYTHTTRILKGILE